MKIALFCDTYIPVKNGLVSMVSQIKSALEEEGHEAFLFCPDYPEHTDTEQNIIRIPSVGVPLKLDDRLPITIQKKREIKKFLIDNKIDVIHSHSELGLGLLAKKLAKSCDIRFVHTFHTMWEDYSHYLMVPKISIRKAIQIFFKNVENITTPSVKSFDYLEKVLKRKDITHIPNFIDEKKLGGEVNISDLKKLRGKYHISKKDTLITFVGRVSNEKRVFELVTTYDKYIFPENRDIKLMIIGDGKQFKKIKKFVERSKFKENYILTGYVEWSTINIYYKLCDIYTTISISETHPMTVTEAIFLGLPCVVVEDKSFEGLITDGINGYIGKDIEDYSKKILQLADNPKMRGEFFEENKKVASKYISKNIIQEYIEIYQK